MTLNGVAGSPGWRPDLTSPAVPSALISATSRPTDGTVSRRIRNLLEIDELLLTSNDHPVSIPQVKPGVGFLDWSGQDYAKPLGFAASASCLATRKSGPEMAFRGVFMLGNAGGSWCENSRLPLGGVQESRRIRVSVLFCFARYAWLRIRLHLAISTDSKGLLVSPFTAAAGIEAGVMAE